MDKRRQLISNKKLFKEAKRHLVGGVDSPVRSFKEIGIEPILIKKGKGPYVWDYDGNKYIDYILCWGALILGHAHPAVLIGLKTGIDSGLGFGATNKSEIELAKVIKAAVPFIEKIRFVNSGTEALMGAIRLARGYTKKDKIIIFEKAYHGHVDYLLIKSKGVPRDFLKHTLVAPLGDTKYVENTFKKYSREIAAILVEPVGGNYGVIPPNYDFLKRLRDLADRYNSILIFDEVITGFRFNFGSIAEQFDIKPDLICFGKIIGGGLPIGAYGGREDIMNKLAPLGNVYQAGTFSGNPVVMQAGIAGLKEVCKAKGHYSRLNQLTAHLAFVLKKEANIYGIDLKVSYYGTMFSIQFSKEKQFKRFYIAMLKNGVYFAPSQFEANFMSFAHTGIEIERTVRTARNALGKL